MTAQGNPSSILRRAITSGNLRSVEMALFDVPHVDLEDALEILALMAREGDPRRAAWSHRWLQRVAAGQHERVELQLDQLPDVGALEELRTVARQLRRISPSTRIAAQPPGPPA